MDIAIRRYTQIVVNTRSKDKPDRTNQDLPLSPPKGGGDMALLNALDTADKFDVRDRVEP